MKRHISLALIALNLAACLAAPQNQAPGAETSDNAVSVVAERSKGDADRLESFQNDMHVKICSGGSCKWGTAGEAKGMDPATVLGLFAPKGDEQMTRALTPAVETLDDSHKGLDAQKAMLEKLQREMAAMTSSISKGQAAAEAAKGQYADITKGISFAPPPSKGFAPIPPSKGASSAALEAAMCPMTMYELGKCQKLKAETDQQLANAQTMTAMLMNQKSQMEREMAVMKMQKEKAEQQAAFNAKYAAEQKQRADMLAMALTKSEAEKAACESAKAKLESDLAATQAALIQEQQENAALRAALQSCQAEKDNLESQNRRLAAELAQTRQQLEQTQTELANEKVAHEQTRRELAQTETELSISEDARRQLEEAKQELEDELAETKRQLENCENERAALQEQVVELNGALIKCNEEKMQCQAELALKTAENEQLTNQLQTALQLLEAEKKAREELLKTIMEVKAGAEKLQEEVRKLQIQNVALQQQVMKLKSEQETALAMAAGCPPTYEKFGLSCYKYVREKTQWKMAQEQCMKDGGNLVSIESKIEQAYLVDYLKRHGASESDIYAHTSGYKHMNMWKWLGSGEAYIGQSGPQYWFNELTKMKKDYDCQAMYLRDHSTYGKWVGLPCFSRAAYTCEYLLAAPGSPAPTNAAETMAGYEMMKNAPAYINSYQSSSKGSLAFNPPTKGAMFAPPSKGYVPLTKGSYRRV